MSPESQSLNSSPFPSNSLPGPLYHPQGLSDPPRDTGLLLPRGVHPHIVHSLSPIPRVSPERESWRFLSQHSKPIKILALWESQNFLISGEVTPPSMHCPRVQPPECFFELQGGYEGVTPTPSSLTFLSHQPHYKTSTPAPTLGP